MTTLSVRPAEDDDLPALFRLGREMRAESRIPFPEIDEAIARETLAALGDAYVTLVAVAEHCGSTRAADADGGRAGTLAIPEAASELVGMLTGQINRYAFAADLFAQHDIFYVRRNWRGSRAAGELVRAFENWARGAGAKRTVLAVHTGLFPERTGRFYQKLGYRPMGGNFMKELER